MYDSFLVREGSLANVYEDGKAVGFKFDGRIGEYRGCFLSLVHGYYVNMDGGEYPRSVQKFEVNGKAPRTFEEIKKATWEHWDYGDFATLYVEKEGGQEKRAYWGLLAASVLLFVVFYPVISGLVVPAAYIRQVIPWLPNWRFL